MTGSFLMSCNAEVKIKLPELNVTALIFAPFHVTSQKNDYNIIFYSNWNKSRFTKQLCWLERYQNTHDIVTDMCKSYAN